MHTVQAIYSGDFLMVDKHRFEDKVILRAYWRSNNAEMTDEMYREEMVGFIKILHEIQPFGVLGDMHNFTFTISPATQLWLNENLFSVYIQLGFDKHAIVVSQDLFSQISIEQTIEEERTEAFETRYFDDPIEALSWLKT